MKRIGPGPAKYLLPPTVGFDKHDITKERKPMYSMGAVSRRVRATDGPGSAKYYLENKTQYGEKHIASYIGRQFSVDNKRVGPGPAKYLLPTTIGSDRTKVWNEKSPDFLFGRRLENRLDNAGPGPSKYMLPDTMGVDMKNIYANKRPMYSMAKRTKQNDFSCSPGPAKYDPRKKDEHAILITMKSRHAEKMYQKSPGANKYNLMEYKPGKKPPQFSMGIALSGYAQPMIIPGDNCC